MKIKANFALRKIADNWVVLPLAEQALNFNGMISLNESGVFLWKLLEQGSSREDMAKALTEEYEVNYDEAIADVDEFVKKLADADCVEP